MNYDWEALFHELSFKERIKIVISGLKCPVDSGEHKEARYQLKRLASPISAVTVPLLIILLVTFLAGWKREIIPESIPVTRLKDPEPIPKIEKLKKEPIEKIQTIQDIVKEISQNTGPTASDAPPEMLELNQDPSPALSLIRSPVFLPTLLASGGAKIRGQGLAEGNGSSETERAVIQALRWLKHVQEEDGSWSQESGGGPGKGTPPAMTGLALMTFLAHGDTPASEEFGGTIEKAIKWLLTNQEPDGRFKGRDNHDYSHPIATYALCEAFHVTKIPMLREASEKAVTIIINGQNLSGGWDYNCKQSERNDTSYMGWCIQALKAAYIAKLENPGLVHAIEKAAKGLQRNAHTGGGFGYTGPNPSNLTGVGVLCLQLLGKDAEPAVKQGVMWLDNATFNWSEPWGNDPLYHWYYVTQVKFRASKEIWDKWNPIFSTELVNNQTIIPNEKEGGNDMGFWKACSEKEHCKSYVYNTTLCTLMLEVYYRHLQTFQTFEDILEDPDALTQGDVPIEIVIDNS